MLKKFTHMHPKGLVIMWIRCIYTPTHTMSQNNLKVTTKKYEKKCLLFITKNKKYSSTQVIPITYTLEKRVFAVATFQGLWLVSFRTK